MEAFLPSEIGRLIYGYLFQQCGESLAEEFLNSCDSMRECRLLKQKYAKHFHHKVQDLSLEDILNQYSVLCSLIFKQVTGEEPIHRNILSLLKKVISSKLGLSSSSLDRSRIVTPVSNKTGSIAEPEQQRSLANDEDVVFSPAVSDAGDDSIALANGICDMDTSQNDSSTNTTKEAAPVVNSAECLQKNISPNIESRICGIISDSASLEDRSEESIGRVNLPFPADYRTPCKQVTMSVPTVPTFPGTNTANTINSIESTVRNTSSTVEDVSKDLPLAAESSPAGLQSSECLSKKTANDINKKKKVLQRGTKKKPSKASSKSPVLSANIDTTLVTTDNLVLSAMVVPDVEVSVEPKVTTPKPSSFETPPATTILVSLTPVQMPTISSVCPEPIISATTVSSTNILEAPIMTSSDASIPDVSTENVFGEFSFESECSEPSKLNKSSSSVRSDNEVGGKLPWSPSKHTPRKADAISPPVDSPVLTRSEETILQNPTPRKAVPFLRSATKKLSKMSTNVINATALPLPSEAASASSSNEEIPWDVNLRLFVENDSSVDAHINKRKPKNLKIRKYKEIPRKRKYNVMLEDSRPLAKRFKSDAVAAVPVSVATPRQQPLASKSTKTDTTVDLASSPLRRRSSAKDTESTFEAERKSDRNKKAKGGNGHKTTSESANLLRSSTSMNDIIDFSNPIAEKINKAAAVEKKKQQVANTRKPIKKEIREFVKARSNAKRVSSVDEVINLTEIAKGRRKSEQILKLVAPSKEQKDVVDPENATFNESNLSHVKERPSSSPTEILPSSKSHVRNTKSEVCDDVDQEAHEIMENLHQISINEKQDRMQDSIYDDNLDFEMVLEVSPEFELYCKSSQCSRE